MTSFLDSTSLENMVAVDPASGDVWDKWCIDGNYGGCNVETNWIGKDLTAHFGGLTARYGTLTSFTDSFGDHAFYVDYRQHLNEISTQFLSVGVAGSVDDLGVQSTGGISAYSSPGLFTYASTVLERLFYETADQHVHMLLSSNGVSFADTDLTGRTGNTLAMPGSEFTSFHDASGEHAFYFGANQHLYQLYGNWISYTICNPMTRICGPVSYIKWVNQDLTLQTNGPQVLAGLTSFSDATGEYVFYVAKDLHIHELNDGKAGWADQDLTKTAAAILPFTAGPMTGLTSLSNALGRQLFYFGTDLNVHQILLNGTGGSDADLTIQAKGPMASPCFSLKLTGFTRTPSNQVESDVFYPAIDGSIHRLSQPGTEHLLFGGFPIWLGAGWTDVNVGFPAPFSCLN